MEIQYRHANPYSGRESVVLRIDGLLADQTVCVLIDAGENVSTADLLDEADDEYLSAVCLTHAHLDHYQSLGEALDHAAPLYAAPDTAQILEDVFEAGEDHYDLAGTDRVLEQLTPIDEWTQIVSGLRVCPVPAGHAPGAAGFLFEVEDGDERRTILITGDFTMRRAAGYPGFDPEAFVDVDAVVLTAATSADFESTLTDAVGTVCERVRAGSTVLATASGLTGVQIAYLLGHLTDERGEAWQIILVGQVATLYEQLGYDVPNVEAIPDFTDPSTVLTPGGVTIAGPEVPVDGSAGRLYETIADDPGATLVQLTGGATEPVTGDACTTHQFTLSNHPTEETIDDIVETLSPVHVVVTHQQGAAASQYKDKYDSFVWATDDTQTYTILDETGWTPPPWVTESTTRRVMAGTNATALRFGDGGMDLELPSVERADDVDLRAEGLDIDRLRDRLHDEPEGLAPKGVRGEQTTDADCPDTTNSVPDPNKAGMQSIDESDAEPSLTDIDARLQRIEAAVADSVVEAHVVDAGDGTILLRLEDPPDELEHGQQLRIRLPADLDTEDGHERNGRDDVDR
ncbi:putative exonuclease of the beta-lactamase fold involved in RNA processing [Halovivax ruber XH-70]|uniref:Putative exonuclease of the beta-lactamase fold involved in RNA processing n=1 Tax=Halovivax ruber (strain DSM 18193 / JCM 13892 / XH-70) TaxID=797302 RepID=L0IEY4_HALRX|nr:MBL fold metallo-hydrolase [Halovivax ruber]AGB17393.1 putative exonuclease of the beta-lactamase fold involved in RNA processing [Halovivax ruber XH-70]